MGKIQDLDKFYCELGDNIRTLRSKQGYSQEDLAKFLELTRTSVVNIEQGRQRPTIHALSEIASFLNVPFAYLLPTLDEKEQIDLLKATNENFTITKKRFKDISLDKEKFSHFLQLSSSK